MKKKPYHHLPDGTFRNPEGSPKRDPNVKWSYKIFNQEKKKLDMTVPKGHVVEKEKVLVEQNDFKNAENLIMQSNLIWTIIRPTMIYGSPRDRNMIRLIKWIDHFPILPIFGNGNALQQPINVKDLVNFIHDTIDKKEAFKNVFNLS